MNYSGFIDRKSDISYRSWPSFTLRALILSLGHTIYQSISKNRISIYGLCYQFQPIWSSGTFKSTKSVDITDYTFKTIFNKRSRSFCVLATCKYTLIQLFVWQHNWEPLPQKKGKHKDCLISSYFSNFIMEIKFDRRSCYF